MTSPTPDTIPESVLEAMEAARRENVTRSQTHVDGIRAALQAAEALGYVLVPREPTQAMLNAAFDVCNLGGDAQPTEIWPEMIAAAPKVTG